MTKLNPNLKRNNSKFDTEKLAGGYGALAAKQSNIAELRRCVLANLLWEKIAYVDGISVADNIKRLIPLCNAKDVFNLAIEARLLQKLRHTPLFIAREMCKYPETRKYVGELLPKIITRADMLTDFLALYWEEGKRPIAAQAKKGLAKAFDNFNEYQLAKYDRDSAIKLRDVLFLTHAKPAEGKEELYSKIANRTLKTPDTWEVALSTGKDKKATWERLIQQNKIGGLAMLRNIRNMMGANVDKSIIQTGLLNLKATMLLPLDFLKTARINPEFDRHIEDAMIRSYESLPKLPGKTLFIVDVSGSMGSLISSGSEFSRLDQACAMAMLAINQCEDYELVATAGRDGARKGMHEHIKYPKKGFDVFKQIVETKTRIGGGGIFTKQCLDWCYENVGKEFDRIIIFSDSQDVDNYYGNKVIPNPYGKNNYIVDVSSHSKGINYKGVWTAEISGWSEHFLTFISAYEGLENMFNE